MNNKVLVTGGCGYIGAHTIVDLIEHGFEVFQLTITPGQPHNSWTGLLKLQEKKLRIIV